MELQTERNEAAALPSASVVLLRDGAAGLEVFLVRRHGLSDVLGGAYVFPGGKVDREDAQLAARLDLPADQLHAALGEADLAPSQACALFVAAAREAFEETGVLLADLPPADGVRAWQAQREGAGFAEIAARLDLRLQASRLVPWSRWVTPVVGGVVRKRFDTRFFIAAVPPGQEASHDGHEATASVWLAPREALLRYWEGGMELAPPQIMSLAQLARHADLASVLAAAGGRRPPCIRPESYPAADGSRLLCYPGHPRHSEARRALPGPTCLHWRQGRFEPEGGLAALLAD